MFLGLASRLETPVGDFLRRVKNPANLLDNCSGFPMRRDLMGPTPMIYTRL
jgi:hypothetical protein